MTIYLIRSKVGGAGDRKETSGKGHTRQESGEFKSIFFSSEDRNSLSHITV